MSLSDIISGVERAEKTLTVYNPAEGVADDLRERFADRNLAVVEERSLAGPDDFVVLSHEGTFITAVAADELLGSSADVTPGFERETYRPILDHLDEAMFTSYDRGRMLSASREIEDRAWRVGNGSLHAGFQTAVNFEAQSEVYSRLATRTDLSVHAYVHPDGEVSPPENVCLHRERTSEIRTSWFVVFDGGMVADNECALLAAEREPGRFYGFWTYDGDTVQEILDHLQSTYVAGEADDGGEYPELDDASDS
jgi:DICT domain-containing protein